MPLHEGGLTLLALTGVFLGDAFAIPVKPRDATSSISMVASATTSWHPDLYIAPVATASVNPSYNALYADTDGSNLLISMNPGSFATPSLILQQPSSSTSSIPLSSPSVPIVQLPVATDSGTPPPPAPSTSTIFSTVWVTETPASTMVTVTSTMTPSPSPTQPSTTSAAPAATPSSSAASPSPPSNSTGSFQPIIATYYPDWTSDDLLPEQVDFTRFDWVDFAFAVPGVDFSLSFTEDDSTDLLARLVKQAHSANPPKRVKLSVGGWDGSTYFSDAVRTPENIATFVKNIKQAVQTYGVDGIDIDWEYPGVQGAGNNDVSPSDTINFLAFLQSLRSALGPSALLTAAVSTSPFYIPSQNSTNSVDIFQAFGRVLDYILLMNYDVHDNTSPSPGANAPLLSHGPACPDSQPSVSAELAIDDWTKAGFPVSQILLGVPSYGYADTSSATVLTETDYKRKRSWKEGFLARRNERRQGTNPSALLSTLTPGPVVSSAEFDNAPLQEITAPMVNLASSPTPSTASIVSDSSGQVQFNYLVQQGALVYSSTPSPPPSANQNDTSGPPSYFVGSGSYTRYWDACSSTPYLVSQSQNKVIPYDDPASLQMKAQYAMQRGLGGVNMFDVHGDTSDWDLTDALRFGLGLPQVTSTSP